MRKVIAGLAGALLLLAGIALIASPFISNYLFTTELQNEITKQFNTVENTDEKLIEAEFQAAEKYNKNLLGDRTLTDPFESDPKEEISDSDYENLLNLNHDSLMGSIEIPKIGVKLPIYHGTSPEVLSKGIGHMSKTSLPIGGTGTHAVLTGHTGLSNAELFSNLDELEEGDVFFIYVLNRTLAYQVDQIKIVLPSNAEDLEIDPNEDYVTLITCTPSGVNSHRLLVRGTRVDYETAERIAEQTERVSGSWMSDYKKIIIMVSAALLAVVLLIVLVVLIKRRRRRSHDK